MILVTGSGRSGTSAVAQLLHNAGVAVGHDLIAADDANAEGYFEERSLIRLNERILRDLGLHERFSYGSRGAVLAAARLHRDAMHALAAEATPAWKDPRFCWTLEAWLDVLPEAPRVVVCLRSPEEVAASTMRYFGRVDHIDRLAVYHLWRAQHERLLDVIEDYGLETVCVEYAGLIAEPETAIEPLARLAGTPLDAASVRRDLRHHEAGVPEELSALYQRVRTLGIPPEAERSPHPGGARAASAPSRS